MPAIDYPALQFGRGSAAYVEWETHYRLRDERCRGPWAPAWRRRLPISST